MRPATTTKVEDCTEIFEKNKTPVSSTGVCTVRNDPQSMCRVFSQHHLQAYGRTNWKFERKKITKALKSIEVQPRVQGSGTQAQESTNQMATQDWGHPGIPKFTAIENI